MRGTLMAIRTPVSTSLNDFKQREAACLHVLHTSAIAVK